MIRCVTKNYTNSINVHTKTKNNLFLTIKNSQNLFNFLSCESDLLTIERKANIVVN